MRKASVVLAGFLLLGLQAQARVDPGPGAIHGPIDPVENLVNPIVDPFLRALQPDRGIGGGDASDDCRKPDPPLQRGDERTGLLDPWAGDSRDNYRLTLASGERILLTLRPFGGVGAGVPSGLWAPGVGGAGPFAEIDLAVFSSSDCVTPLAVSRHDGLRSEVVHFVAPAAGTYSLQVFVRGSGSGGLDGDGDARASGGAPVQPQGPCRPECGHGPTPYRIRAE